MDVANLNKKFGIADKVEFLLGSGGLPIVRISNIFGKVEVSVYGAQVFSYIPKSESEVLWMSSKSTFEHGKAIRGGIPVCFPWFGPHATDSQKPMHGFARVQTWEVAETINLPDGETQLRLTLKENSDTKTLWPYSFTADLIVTLGSSLEVTLRCRNTGSKEFTYTDALHSYFAVSNIEKIKIKGLKDGSYYNGIDGKISIKQNEDILEIRKEENRRYIDTTSECIIEDSGMQRKIRVKKKGSRTTVVWNPWIETAKKFSDMTEDGYKTMLCIEAANAYSDIVVVPPNDSFSLSTEITVEKI